MIKKHKHEIHEIYVSMDSHQPAHIAHAMFWASGEDGMFWLIYHGWKED